MPNMQEEHLQGKLNRLFENCKEAQPGGGKYNFSKIRPGDEAPAIANVKANSSMPSDSRCEAFDAKNEAMVSNLKTKLQEQKDEVRRWKRAAASWKRSSLKSFQAGPPPYKPYQIP